VKQVFTDNPELAEEIEFRIKQKLTGTPALVEA